MAKTKLPCPACKRTFPNKGGLQAHLNLSKDSGHAGYRAANPAGSKRPAPPRPTPAPAPQQGGTGGGSGLVQVAWSPPASSAPLLPPPPAQAPAPAGAPPVAQAPAVAKAPTLADLPALEPVIDGGVAAICNGFFLRGEGDEPISTEEVHETRFGFALEYSVRKYWPDLPLDHPLVVLGTATAALAMVVGSKKAKKPKKGKEPAKPAEPSPPAPAPQAQPAQEAAAPVEDEAQAYWSGIVQKAGGPAAAEDDRDD